MRNPWRSLTSFSFLYYDLAFRNVLIEKAVKVSLDLNNIVVRFEEEDYWISLDEISTLIIDDPRCNVSLRLLMELCKKGISVIFTDESHMPVGTLTTLYNHSRAVKKIEKQIAWDENGKEFLWTRIVEKKINSQIDTLKLLNKIDKIEILERLLSTVSTGDSTNREGIVSRVYFKALFGNQFKRFSEDIINFSLNYTYQIIRSKLSQEIVASGYLPSLGICHKSEYNFFNLADDFIEPFRPIVDYFVYDILMKSESNYLTPNIKRQLVNILNQKIMYEGCEYKIHIVIQFYVQNLLNFLETGDIQKIKFPSLIWII